MGIEFDPRKSAENVRKRGIGFELFADMDLEQAVSLVDQRRNYSELRLRVLGVIGGRLYAAVITPRGERTFESSACDEPIRAKRGLMRKNVSHPDDENPEWTAEEIRSARPLMEVLPPETAAAIRRYKGQRGPQRAPTKELISLRVDRDIVARFRATGAGWQTRANDALKAYVKKGGLTKVSQPRRRRRSSRPAGRTTAR